MVVMPTLSAAANANEKFLRFSCGVRLSYGILSGRYVCSNAHNASPSFHELEKFVMSVFR